MSSAAKMLPDTLLDELRGLVGGGNVSTEALECEYFAQDVFSKAAPAAAVVAPENKQQLAGVVRAAVDSGVAVVARGGGMSYTGGYVPNESNSIVIDMSRMSRVLEINQEDMYVTVEAGISWAALHQALEDTGLRTPYWGTLSGLYATVGGGLSQNSVFWGSGRHGTAVDSVIGLEVVLADGRILKTGSGSQRNASPFFRHYGPDLTGLFCCDCGALGVKAIATLRLIPEPEAQAFASFAFERYEDMAPAMSEISRGGLASECFGFDPVLQAQRMKRESLTKDAKQFVGALKSAGGLGKAIKQGAKMAVAGRRFMDDVKWSFHFMTEARTEASAQSALNAAREIVSRHNGRELADSIPRLVRANPFGPVNSMLGPEGERWVPVHGLLPHSKAVECIGKINALFDQHCEEMAGFGIQVGFLLATVSTHCFVIEPVFFWPDELMEIHRRSVEPDHLRRLNRFEQNLPAREAVTRLRRKLVELLTEAGAVHLQIGKSYLYREGLRPESYELVSALKKVLDPECRINPGCLGLKP